MRAIHKSQRSFSESFFHVLNWWYFLYQPRPHCDPKKSFSGSSKTVILHCCMKHNCNSVRWIHTSQRNFYESFFLHFFWGYFLCHCKLHCVPRYPNADFQKTVLANWKLKRNVYLRELHSHIETQFLRRLLCSLISGNFLFHHSLQSIPKYHFAEHKITELANCCKKGRVELCVMKSHFR